MSVCGETIVRDFSDLVCLCELVEFCRVLSQSTAELWMRYDRKGEGRKNGITSSVPPCSCGHLRDMTCVIVARDLIAITLLLRCLAAMSWIRAESSNTASTRGSSVPMRAWASLCGRPNLFVIWNTTVRHSGSEYLRKRHFERRACMPGNEYIEDRSRMCAEMQKCRPVVDANSVALVQASRDVESMVLALVKHRKDIIGCICFTYVYTFEPDRSHADLAKCAWSLCQFLNTK